ncbi:helix-turn-helix domain-containing protein [Rubellimicrobium rubrum]|uniref:helix-turn-helix domain-containing protein n=1 Tax=Rubellimicrobium rubrum TaxID=2585369 RepID=UPI003CCC4971
MGAENGCPWMALCWSDECCAAMANGHVTQAELSRSIGVDRSTVSQLLDPDALRLPNAQVAAECANVLGVSADWLLGLSDDASLLRPLLRHP